MAEEMMSSSLLVNRTRGSMMETFGTSDRLIIDIFTCRATSVMMQNWEISEPEPAVVGRKIMGGRGRMMRLAPS